MSWNSERDIAGVRPAEMLRRVCGCFVGYSERNDRRELRVVASSLGSGCAYLVEQITVFATNQVFNTAKVVMFKREEGDFRWRIVSELEGPVYYAMPERLFRQLTPLDQFPEERDISHAVEWRNAVKAYRAKASTKVSVGGILQFDRTFAFKVGGRGYEAARFKVLEWGRKKRFLALCTDGSQLECRLKKSVLMNDYVVQLS